MLNDQENNKLEKQIFWMLILIFASIVFCLVSLVSMQQKNINPLINQ